MERCPWCLCNEKMTRYHDEEWGIPLHDDYRQFEFLMMEVMPKPHPSTSQDFCMMGRRRGGSPRRMTEWERRGVEGGCPARFGQRPHQ